MELSPRKSGNQFKVPKKSLNGIDAVEAGRLLAAAADIALVIDSKGIIRDIACNGSDFVQDSPESWIGRAWVDTVTIESRFKIEEILRDTTTKSPPRARQVNHPSAHGPDLPVKYSAVKLESEGRIVAVGRDLRSMAVLQQKLFESQQSLEREYARLNTGESRYRLLFQVSAEAVIIVDAATWKIVELNPAAERLLTKKSKRTSSYSLNDCVAPASIAALTAMLDTVKFTGRAEDIFVRLTDHPDEHQLSGSLFRQGSGSHYLLRLTSTSAASSTTPLSKTQSMLATVVNQLPDGFVVTNPHGLILSANTSFLDLAEIATPERARTLTLDQFVGEPGVDFTVLTANLREHGSVRNFATRIRGENGSTSDVEITGVASLDGELPCLAFTIRPDRRTTKPQRVGASPMTRSVEQMTELVGRVSLKELVRESTDIIERLCIEAALELTNDNRASAADMLGLSRQSLYVKLRRYGLGELDSAND
jgi:transcriptional regulator PpsR